MSKKINVIDEEALAKSIMKEVAIHYEPKDTKGQIGFAEMCNICGGGSTSFCPCSTIVRMLQEVSEGIIKANLNEA